MKRMLVLELYLHGYVPELESSARMRCWLGLESSLLKNENLRLLFGPLVARTVVTGLEYEDGKLTTDEKLFIGQISEASYMKDAGFVQEMLVRRIIEEDAAMVHFSEAMQAKYQGRQEHPVCHLCIWQQHVASARTKLGYWEWVCEQVEKLNVPGTQVDARVIVVRHLRGNGS